ncbi:hypothetical protein F5B22DRAFT_648890 [Xylaria bambusicola]|uniref:uncharacterized protein n=1 Tax=Xylaria bambusicola TaxID=326684 RepID=UPI0020072A17|nr:uncharacterized protein F5B22DRAFT_648890 [Xylaria bambusicola]KAI0509657.1 hypothetical protein F5B22DRAFT_648890 [Xylaria bambusicola]
MQPPFPCPVETWRNDTYEAISPSRPELSVAGKTVVIIGAGGGIGQETALAFAAAGASTIALLGRTETTLEETASKIKAVNKCLPAVHVADVTNEADLNKAAAIIGKWHILVISCGWCPTPSPLVASGVGDWWAGYEVNVKGTLLAAKTFLPTADRPNAAFLSVISDISFMPAAHLLGLSSYITANLAKGKIFEFLAAENPDVFVATMHPGMVDTDNFRRSGATPENLPMDTAQLPAHFLVWLASPEAAFLRGRCASANWDVEELKALRAKYTDSLFMSFGSKGLP